jgi:hypothetical protein
LRGCAGPFPRVAADGNPGLDDATALRLLPPTALMRSTNCIDAFHQLH